MKTYNFSAGTIVRGLFRTSKPGVNKIHTALWTGLMFRGEPLLILGTGQRVELPSGIRELAIVETDPEFKWTGLSKATRFSSEAAFLLEDGMEIEKIGEIKGALLRKRLDIFLGGLRKAI